MAAAANLKNKQTSNKGYHKTRSRLWAVSLFLENPWGRMRKKKVCKRNMQAVILWATSTCSMGIGRWERETALVSYNDLDTTCTLTSCINDTSDMFWKSQPWVCAWYFTWIYQSYIWLGQMALLLEVLLISQLFKNKCEA